jgi:hypothetical protein
MAKIVDEQNGRSTVLLSGKAETFDDYKAKAAYLQALRDVQDWCAEVRDDLTQPEDKPSRQPKSLRQTAGYSGV